MDIVFLDADQIRSTSGDFKDFKLLYSKPGMQISDFDIDIRKNLIYWTSGNIISNISIFLVSMFY